MQVTVELPEDIARHFAADSQGRSMVSTCRWPSKMWSTTRSWAVTSVSSAC